MPVNAAPSLGADNEQCPPGLYGGAGLRPRLQRYFLGVRSRIPRGGMLHRLQLNQYIYHEYQLIVISTVTALKIRFRILGQPHRCFTKQL